MVDSPLLEVKNLHVDFQTYLGKVQAVRNVSFTVGKGEIVALVGESGCGKSVTAQSLMGLIPNPPGKIEKGEIIFQGTDLLAKPEAHWEKIRGEEISMVFQDPMTSLNPTMRIGEQIAEGLYHHYRLSKREARAKIIEILKSVGISHPEKRIDQYPHEFSGGMRQRAVIAIALACEPKLLIADEPTTALDVTVQAQILELLKEIRETRGTSILLITHDLGIVAGLSDRVLVMYAGSIVEEGTVETLYSSPLHPYTQGLLRSVPRLDMSKNQDLSPILGAPPNLLMQQKGCPFFNRCEHALKICQHHLPEWHSPSSQQAVKCWLQQKEKV